VGSVQDVLLLDLRDKEDFESFHIRVRLGMLGARLSYPVALVRADGYLTHLAHGVHGRTRTTTLPA